MSRKKEHEKKHYRENTKGTLAGAFSYEKRDPKTIVDVFDRLQLPVPKIDECNYMNQDGGRAVFLNRYGCVLHVRPLPPEHYHSRWRDSLSPYQLQPIFQFVVGKVEYSLFPGTSTPDDLMKKPHHNYYNNPYRDMSAKLENDGVHDAEANGKSLYFTPLNYGLLPHNNAAYPDGLGPVLRDRGSAELQSGSPSHSAALQGLSGEEAEDTRLRYLVEHPDESASFV